jgi:hypothetical protein
MICKLAHKFYVSLKAHNKGNLGTYVLVLVLEALNNENLHKINYFLLLIDQGYFYEC